jgi:serine protease inhibitor
MSGKQTSAETYYEIKHSGLLSNKRLQVYEILYEMGNLTGSQVSRIHRQKYPTNSMSEVVRNRITELVQMGVVEELGIVKDPFNGRDVTLYGTTDNLPKDLEIKKTRKQLHAEMVERKKLAMEHLVIWAKGNNFPEQTLIGLRKIYNQINSICKDE